MISGLWQTTNGICVSSRLLVSLIMEGEFWSDHQSKWWDDVRWLASHRDMKVVSWMASLASLRTWSVSPKTAQVPVFVTMVFGKMSKSESSVGFFGPWTSEGYTSFLIVPFDSFVYLNISKWQNQWFEGFQKPSHILLFFFWWCAPRYIDPFAHRVRTFGLPTQFCRKKICCLKQIRWLWITKVQSLTPKCILTLRLFSFCPEAQKTNKSTIYTYMSLTYSHISVLFLSSFQIPFFLHISHDFLHLPVDFSCCPEELEDPQCGDLCAGRPGLNCFSCQTLPGSWKMFFDVCYTLLPRYAFI